MVGISAVALSGYAASEKRLAVAAENIANAESPDFKAKKLEQSSDAAGGVTTRVVDKSPATVKVATTDGSTADRPNVSLEEEVVQSQVSTYSAKANLKVLQTQNHLDKYLLDIQA